MNQANTPEQWREPFPDEEISHILAALLRCSSDLRKAESCEHENRLTVRLAKLLSLDATMLKRPVHLDWEVWEIGMEKAELLGRLDLRYLYSTGVQHPWPCFAIEAKRLHVTFPKGGWKSLVSEYVTGDTGKSAEEEQGMMCFVTGRYSGGLRSGAMLGYVYDGDVERARIAIHKAIVEHSAKLRFSTSEQIKVSAIVPNELRITESVHELPQRQFRIFHVLFGV